MASSDFVKLPEQFSDLKSIFPGLDLKKILENSQNPEKNFTPSQSLIWKYAGGALLAGRPLNTTMLFMGGISGAGKSTTINVLFGDPTLCGTNSSTSSTKDVVLIQKTLKVSGDKLPVVGNLSFVDVPGTFDTDSKNEAMNLASIRKFVGSCVELTSRNKLASQIPKYYFDLSPTTFPNIVLFALRATDNRMSGPNSFFRKSLQVLKDTAQLIDVKRPNFIVILTHAMSLPRKREKFEKALAEKIATIRLIVHEILGILDVDIIPVENRGEDYEMEKFGDFYMFPDGQLSHGNLFNAMLRRFDSNKDLLSRILVGWYFKTSCPEKNNQAKVIKPDKGVTDKDIAIAENDLSDLNISAGEKEGLAPYYNFQSLGRGYCPVTEEVKPISLLTDEYGTSPDADNWQLVKVENSRFLIPSCVTPYIKSVSTFQCLTYFDKEQYEGHMKASYGLEAGFKMMVSASSEGRWVTDSKGHSSTALISLVQEMQIATLKLDNPKKHIISKTFLRDLDLLPESFSKETGRWYQAFFSKWGTHLIYEQALGGAVQLNSVAQKVGLTEEKLKEIEVKVSGMYKAFSASVEGSYEENNKSMKEAGLSNESFQIEGGISPGMVTLASMNKTFLDKWSKTVGHRPVELRKSIKLYPYYNLLESGKKYDSLRQATKDYLEDTFENKVADAFEGSRDNMGDNAVNNGVNQKGGGDCFPRGTQILLQNGSSIAIERLHLSLSQNQDISTFKLTNGLSSSKLCLEASQRQIGTKFCTYLDYEIDTLVDYLVFRFSNAKELRVSPGHLILEFVAGGQGQISGKQAKDFKVGEMMVYFSKEGTAFETPFIEEIGMETLSGKFTPLTTSGTFFADGFLVTSYADIDSFSTAQAGLLPLKIWTQMKNKKANKIAQNLKSGAHGAKESTLELSNTEWKQGIHPYAQFLIDFRHSFTSFIPALK